MEDIIKTGTTTLGMKINDGVILAADRRVTAGYRVVNKAFKKIVQIDDDIVVTIAGTVSDTQLVLKWISAELKLNKIRRQKPNSVKAAVNLLANIVYSNIRKMSMIPGISHFIVGGKDDKGFHLYEIGADGSVSECDAYLTSGSGSSMVYGVMEANYKPKLSTDDGVKLAVKAINAAMQRDIASGNGVDVISISADGVKTIFEATADYNVKA